MGAGLAGITMAGELLGVGIDDLILLEPGELTDPRLLHLLDSYGARDLLRTGCAAPTFEFDDSSDRWSVESADVSLRPRIVVLTERAVPNEPDRAAFTRLPIVGTNAHSIQQLWPAETIPFHGVALAGLPNLFLLTQYQPGNRIRYIRGCVQLLERTSSTRIEVRAATQHEYNRRRHLEHAGPRADPSRSHRSRRERYPNPRHFDLTVPADREPAHEYSGPAMLDAPGAELLVTATLSGYPDPIDGRYHWYGRVAATDGAELPDPGRGQVFLTLPGRSPAAGLLQERDPWGQLRIVGLGEPPYPMPAAS